MAASQAPLASDSQGGAASDSAATSYSLKALRTPAQFRNKVEQLKRERAMMEADWRLNLAFYRGRQYSYFNRATGRIDSLPTEDGDKPRYRVRLVSNQVGPGVQSLVGKWTKTKPQISATPGDGSQQLIKAAEMAERLFEMWWDEFSLDDKEEEALTWSAIAGQGFWKLTFDQFAGHPMQFMVNPQDGQPIIDQNLKDIFRSTLAQQGLDPTAVERTLYLGEIKVEVMSPFDVYLDTSAKTFDECQFAFCKHNLTPDEIEARWNVTVKPDGIPTGPDQSLPFRNTDQSAAPQVKAVWVGYLKPSASLPKGRYVVWCDGVDKLLEDKPWQYPTRELPLVKFPGKRVPGSVYDDPIVTDARPIQKELNRSLSQIVEFKNLTVRPRVWAPVNSLVSRLTTEPGTVNYYNPVNGAKPEWEQLGSMPAYVFQHVADTVQRIKDIFGQNEMDQGAVPPNVEAGVAIDLLQEQAADRFAPQVKLIEKALERAGQQMLALAQQYYTEPRLLKIKGAGGSTQVKRFTQADIKGGIDITVETGSGLPRTRAGRQERIMRYVELGIIQPDQAWKYIDMADLKAVAMKLQADEDQALREHDRIMQGQPVSQAAIIDAQEQVQQLMQQAQSGQPDPQTGEPMDPQAAAQQAQQIMQDAQIAPGPADNHQTHMDIHGTFIKSMEFEAMPPEIQDKFLDHWQKHREIWFSIPQMPQPQAAKVSYQIKSTIGPTAAQKILARSGVPDVTADDMAEPPLETWISDSVDKPDDPAAMTAAAEAARKQQEMEQQLQMQQAQHDQRMQHAEESHALKTGQALGGAQASGDVSALKLGHQQQSHHQSLAHKHQAHQQDMQHKLAQARLAAVQAAKQKAKSGGK